MKKIIAIFAAGLFLTACGDNNTDAKDPVAKKVYGEQVTINNSKVYYKGDGVSEADAKKLGDFLLGQNYFDASSEKTVQLSKDSGSYVVKFFVDDSRLSNDTVTNGFVVLQALIEDSVFNGNKTKVFLADEASKVMKEVEPMDKSMLQ